MMKRLLTIFIIACVFFSCENDRPANDPNNGQKPIKFDMTETRAAVTDNDINDNGFGVFAFVNDDAESTTFVSLFGDEAEEVEWAEKVEWDDAIGGWTYDDIQYWESERVYHFFGVFPFYPFDAIDNPYSIIKDISGNPTGISRTFTTPDEADQDIVAAHATYTTAETTPERVVMDFKHILAKVYFKIDYDTTNNKDDEFTIKEFSISNIKKEGTLQSSFNIDNPHSWSVNPLQNMTFKWSGEEKVPVLSLWGKDGLMLIPQTIAPGVVNINVKYTYTDHYVVEGKDGEQIAAPVDKEVDTYLPAITWKPGQQYTYTMTLHEDDLITFRQIEVATWGSPQQGGAIIIK